MNTTTAIKQLQLGNIVACPTESVYGLSCDPQNITAVSALLNLKQRPEHKGLILVAANIDHVLPYTSLSRAELTKITANDWPGAVTFLLPASKQAHSLLTGSFSTIAVRVTAHPVMQELCLSFGGAVVSTSANLAGQSPAKTKAEILKIFGHDFAVLDGKLGGNTQTSRIIDAITNKAIR